MAQELFTRWCLVRMERSSLQEAAIVNQNILFWNVRNGSLSWSAIPLDWETENKIGEEVRKKYAADVEAAAEAERKIEVVPASKSRYKRARGKREARRP
jgi:hypothetical protein